MVNLRDPVYCWEYSRGEDTLCLDFTKKLASNFPNPFEEIDVNLPKALVNEMEITVFVDLDYAHDKVSSG